MDSHLLKEQSLNSHIVSSYANFPQGWSFDFGSCRRMQAPWLIECRCAALEIYKRANEKLTVEVGRSPVGAAVLMVMRYFLRLDVEAAVVRYSKDRNLVRLSFAITLCEILKVPYRVYDLEPGRRLEMVGAENKLGRSVVLDGDFHRFTFRNGEWNLRIDESQWRIHNQIATGKLAAVAQFLWWSPELVASFLSEPKIRRLLAKPPLRPEDPRTYVRGLLYELFKIRWPASFDFESEPNTEQIYIPLSELNLRLNSKGPSLPASGLPRDFRPEP